MFFLAIPEEKWCTNAFECEGRHCARGHITSTKADLNLDLILGARNGWSVTVAVNDGKDPRYQQPTPKQRILAALRDKFGGTP